MPKDISVTCPYALTEKSVIFIYVYISVKFFFCYYIKYVDSQYIVKRKAIFPGIYQRQVFFAIVLDCGKYAIEFHFACLAATVYKVRLNSLRVNFCRGAHRDATYTRTRKCARAYLKSEATSVIPRTGEGIYIYTDTNTRAHRGRLPMHAYTAHVRN